MPNNEPDLLFTVNNISNGLKAAMKETLSTKDTLLSPLYFMILKGIHETENCTAQALTEITFKDKGQIARLIKELISNDIIVKEANPTDKRSQYLRLTDKGLAYYLELKTEDNIALNAMRSGISDKELSLFLKLGKKMANNLSEFNSK